MPNPYSELFKVAGTKKFVAAGFIARMPISMIGIGIIIMLAELKGSYGLAGAVVATFALSSAMLAPQISRVVDRYGQSRVLPIAAGVSASGLFMLLLCTWLDTSNWLLFVFAALSGFIPSISAMSRARWTELFRGKPQLQTAYALESVLDELCFIVGPPISVGLSVAIFPEAGPLVALIMLVVGVTVFVLQKRTEPPVHKVSQTESGSAIRIGTVRILTVLFIALGVIAGTIDIVSVAFAKNQGIPAAASLILSVYAIGSYLSGLAFGAIKSAVPLHRLFLYSGIAMSITTIPILFAWDIMSLACTVLLAGIFFSPTMIVSMAMVETSVPASKLTEGFTWLVSGLGIGVAFGAAISGWVVDTAGISAGFFVALGAGVGVLLVSLFGYSVFKKT